MAQFHIFTFGCAVLPAPFIEDYPFLIVYSCLLCHKLIDCICIGLFLGFLYCITDLSVYFYANTILFWFLQLCSIVWNQEAWCLPLWFLFCFVLFVCLFVKIPLAVWVLLWFYTNFKIVRCISVKHSTLIGIVLNL